MRTLVLVLLAACDGGGYDVVPQAANDCDFQCPMAVGSTLVAFPMAYSDVEEFLNPASATMNPPELADVSVSDQEIVLQARTPGEGILGVTTDSGSYFERRVFVAERATSLIGFAHLGITATPALLEDGALWIHAAYRAADGRRLIGHGFETWSVDGQGGLEEAHQPDTFEDIALIRRLHATTVGTVHVSAGNGTSLDLPVVPSRSITHLGLVQSDDDTSTTETIAMTAYGYSSAIVVALTDDGHYIAGAPAAAAIGATTSDADVVTVDAYIGSMPALRLHAGHVGQATISVDFEGVRRDFTVDVK